MVGEPARRRLDRVETGDLDAAEELAAEELRHDAVYGETKCGFAGAGRADDPDDFAAFDRQIDLGESHPLAARIAIADRLEAQDRRNCRLRWRRLIASLQLNIPPSVP